MTQTIAQRLNIKEFPFEIKDKNGKIIYHEESNGNWSVREFDSRGNQVYFENSLGFLIDNRIKSPCDGKVTERNIN